LYQLSYMGEYGVKKTPGFARRFPLSARNLLRSRSTRTKIGSRGNDENACPTPLLSTTCYKKNYFFSTKS
ncbi:MAG: hypothetical protein EBT69_07175, partial [Verrucomicrobia bacterium]|nr:hypothetical protein [Verrucomicrobiota bacterium]